MSSTSIAASEVTSILESIGKRVGSSAELGSPDDPDTHGAVIEFDPDATRRMRRR
jgi:hypothetical protein